jgi:hypothetical protein
MTRRVPSPVTGTRVDDTEARKPVLMSSLLDDTYQVLTASSGQGGS